MMLSLPSPRTRGAIRAFWIALSLLIGTVAGVLAGLIGGSTEAWLGVPVAAVIAAPGLVWPRRFDLVYRAWDKAARLYSGGASRYLARLCLVTIMVAARDRSGLLQRSRSPSDRSGWVQRSTQGANAYRYQDVIERDGDTPPSRSTKIRAWASDSGNRWAFALVPFVWFLRLLDTGEEPDAAPSAGTYTLY